MHRAPNILLIVLHDLGTHLSCYGQAGVRSPNTDRLASEGVLFEQNFATATYCSPSRGAIITGKWPHCNGLMGLVNLGWSLPQEQKTLGQHLGAAGYETYLFGLQHEVADVEQLGFEHVPEVKSRFCEDVSEEVVGFLNRRGPGESRPFYARVGFTEVHRAPIGYDRYLDAEAARRADPDAEIVPAYLEATEGARTEFEQFNACVEHTDRSIGAILDAIDGSADHENTIVVVTTDHGIDFPWAKGTLYDPGINTTLLVRWPAKVRGDRRLREMVSNIDLMPTLLDAARVSIPDDVQGRSFLPLLVEDTYNANTMVFAEKNTSPNDSKRCVRTERWKYIRNFDEGPTLVLGTCSEYSRTRRSMGDDHLEARPKCELYDLKADRLERVNLSGSSEHEDVETRLDSALLDWMRETDDPQLRGTIPRPSAETGLREKAWSSIRQRFAEIDPDRGS